MPRAYSVALRERVMAAVADGTTMTEVARQFSVSVDAIADWKRLQATTASLAPVLHHIGRPRALSPAQHQLLRERVAEVPDATSREYRDWLETEHQVVVSTRVVLRALTRMHLTRKKESDRHRTGRRSSRSLAGRAAQPRAGGSGLSGRNQHPDDSHPDAWTGTEGGTPGCGGAAQPRPEYPLPRRLDRHRDGPVPRR